MTTRTMTNSTDAGSHAIFTNHRNHNAHTYVWNSPDGRIDLIRNTFVDGDPVSESRINLTYEEAKHLVLNLLQCLDVNDLLTHDPRFDSFPEEIPSA